MLIDYRRQEILNLVADAEVDTTDSPEIGPPPVSQFVDENPVKIDLPKRTSKDEIEELSGLDPTLSINLEQRRKRKDGAGSSESRRASKVEGSHVREATGSLKTGAKRKLSVRDDDEPNLPVPPSSPDDFKYTRVVNEDKAKNKLLPQTEKPAGRITRELAVARGAPREKSTASTAATRKVLAPKSVNDSPKKNSKGLILDDVKSAKGEALKSNVVKERKERRPDSVNVQTSIEPIIRSVEVQTEPETPAAPDIFSPSSSQPSTARESRDTPPPPDLGPGTDGQRPSRRARPAVSYAEPNLRDKMRRPTKELVDAVSKDEKSHRGSFVKLEEDAPSTTVTIKAEPEADDDWKRMPAASSDTVENSPLSSKAPISDTLPSSITTHRKRRESILSQAEADLSRTSSGSAIAALLAENRRAKAAAREKAKENEAAKDKVKEEEATVTKAISKLDIYEFRGSSPNPEDALSKSAKEEKPNSRVSRRLSSVPKDGAAQSESEASDMAGPRKTEGSTSRRRQSTLGLRNSSSTTELGKGLETEKTLKRANSTTGIADSASRSDRISARRRSMML
jgi:Shugoshin C terminus